MYLPQTNLFQNLKELQGGIHHFLDVLLPLCYRNHLQLDWLVNIGISSCEQLRHAINSMLLSSYLSVVLVHTTDKQKEVSIQISEKIVHIPVLTHKTEYFKVMFHKGFEDY